MSRETIRRTVAAVLSFLLVFALAAGTAFAEDPSAAGQENGVVGGTQGGHTNQPSSGDGTTDVWAGVAVDYMFPLRYEVYDAADKKPLEGASIEHYDYNASEYVFVGRTDANGLWQTEVPPSYWMHNIQGVERAGSATVVDTTGLSTGEGALRHRISKDGYETAEGLASVSVENLNNKATGIVRVYLKRASGAGAPGGGALPQTGVQNDWMYLAAGSLLLLIAALIAYKALREEKHRRQKEVTGGSKE